MKQTPKIIAPAPAAVRESEINLVAPATEPVLLDGCGKKLSYKTASFATRRSNPEVFEFRGESFSGLCSKLNLENPEQQ